MGYLESEEGLIDSRRLFENGPLIVEGSLHEDHDGNPAEFDCYSPADMDAWARNEWVYVGVRVRVSWQGVEIGEASLWGVEHGSLDEVECDAWKWEAATKEGNAITMGSPLWGVAGEAVQEAVSWLSGIAGPTIARDALDTVIRWTERADEGGLGTDEFAEFCPRIAADLNAMGTAS